MVLVALVVVAALVESLTFLGDNVGAAVVVAAALEAVKELVGAVVVVVAYQLHFY